MVKNTNNKSKFLDYVLNKKVRIPIHMTFNLGDECNLNCRHCYLKLFNNTNKKELDLEEQIDILNQAAKLGVVSVTLTGGEPLINKNFIRIYKKAYKKFSNIEVVTNATFLNNEILELFNKRPPNLIVASLYSSSDKGYKKITGYPIFEEVISNIKKLSKYNLHLRTPLLKANINEIKNINKISRILTGNNVHVIPFIIGGKMKELRPNKKNFEFYEKIKKSKKNFIKFNNKNIFLCGAGLFSFYITPFGEMTLCSFSRKRSIKALPSLKKSWEKLIEIRRYYENLLSKCSKCNLREKCTWCPIAGELEETSDLSIHYFCKNIKKDKK